MKIDELRSIARSHGLQPYQFSIVELVREIQAAEGNQKCFSTNKCDGECAQAACCWREACIKENARKEPALQTYSYESKPSGWYPGLM